MSSASDLPTVTEERTEVSVATEEVTRYECPVCEQHVDEEELTNTTVGETETALCDYCAASLFDVEADADGFDTARAVGAAADGLRETLVEPLLRLVVKLAGVLLPVYVGWSVFQEVVSGLDPAAFEQAAGATLTEQFMTVLEIVPLVVTLLFMLTIMASVGPRGM